MNAAELHELDLRIRRHCRGARRNTSQVDVGPFRSATLGEWTMTVTEHCDVAMASTKSTRLYHAVGGEVRMHRSKASKLLEELRKVQVLEDLACV